MQVSMPCVLFAASPSELRLKGGTNAEMAPQIDYTMMVRVPDRCLNVCGVLTDILFTQFLVLL